MFLKMFFYHLCKYCIDCKLVDCFVLLQTSLKLILCCGVHFVCNGFPYFCQTVLTSSCLCLLNLNIMMLDQGYGQGACDPWNECKGELCYTSVKTDYWSMVLFQLSQLVVFSDEENQAEGIKINLMSLNSVGFDKIAFSVSCQRLPGQPGDLVYLIGLFGSGNSGSTNALSSTVFNNTTRFCRTMLMLFCFTYNYLALSYCLNCYDTVINLKIWAFKKCGPF